MYVNLLIVALLLNGEAALLMRSAAVLKELRDIPSYVVNPSLTCCCFVTYSPAMASASRL